MIDRLLYILTALALLHVLAFDPNFAVSLSRAFQGKEFTLPSDNWALWVGGIFVVLAAVSLYREIFR